MPSRTIRTIAAQVLTHTGCPDPKAVMDSLDAAGVGLVDAHAAPQTRADSIRAAFFTEQMLQPDLLRAAAVKILRPAP